MQFPEFTGDKKKKSEESFIVRVNFFSSYDTSAKMNRLAIGFAFFGSN